MKKLLITLLMLCSVARAQWVPPQSPSLEYNWKDGDEACEYMFLGLIASISPSQYKPTNLILDRHGDIVWWQKATYALLDFKVHPNGLMSFMTEGKWRILDSTFQVIDTLECAGYNTDVHDILLTDDGHTFLICGEDSAADLSALTTRYGAPGNPNGTLKSQLIQELDAQKNVVAEWHARHYFDLTDSDTTFFTDPDVLHLNHSNSIFRHGPDRMLISHRFNHELTYLRWPSGEIIWRLGGPNNEFTFTNDVGLSAQHFGQILPDGRVSVFDNGTYHQPRRARGLIYELDTVQMTATRVWEYAHPDITSSAYGSFQVLADSSALVNFGAFSPNLDPNMVFLRGDSTVVLEIKIQDLYWTYRAQCLAIPFTIHRPEIRCAEAGGQLILEADSSYGDYLWTGGEQTASITVIDTGDYQVFVPLGIGMVGSEVYRVDDVNGPCAPVPVVDPQPGRGRPAKLLGVYDLCGRPVTRRQRGRLYIEQYSDGSARKVLWR